MKRKLIKLAEKTLVVSLPTDWIITQGLTKGDELDLNIDDYKIEITPPQKILPHKSITINVEGVKDRVLRWEISSLHKKGYDEIIIVNFNEHQNKLVEELIRDLFVGFIIKEKSSLRLVVGQIAAVDVKEFDATLRRAFRHLKEISIELETAFKNKDVELLKQQVEYEHTNNKLTNFCERLLNKHLKQKEEGHFFYVLAWNLEKIADNFKYIANHYETKPVISDDALKIYSELRVYLEEYTKIFFNFNIQKLVKLSEQKKNLESKIIDVLIDGSKQDRVFIHYMHMVVLQLADFSASMIAIKLSTIL